MIKCVESSHKLIYHLTSAVFFQHTVKNTHLHMQSGWFSWQRGGCNCLALIFQVLTVCCSTLCVHTCLYAFAWPCAPCVLLGTWVSAATAPSVAGHRLCTWWNINRTDVIAISGENQGRDERRRGEIKMEVEVKEKKWKHVKGKKEQIWIQRWWWHKGE